MKKLASMLLVLVMVFALAACGGQSADPKEAYQAAVEKNAALTSVDFQMDANMTVKSSGLSVPVTYSVGMKMDRADEENPEFAMNMKMDMTGITFEMHIYYRDGYVYMDVLGQKVKQAMDMQSAMDQLGSVDTSSAVEFTDDMIADIQFAEGNNNQIVLTLNNNALSAMQGILSEATDSSSMRLDDMSFDTFTCTIDLTDGYITKQVVDLNGSYTVDGQEATMEGTITITINNPGQEVKIDFPDFSDYVEASDSGF